MKHLSLNHDQAHQFSGIIGGAKAKRTHLSTYILSVYSLFSDRVGLSLHNTSFLGVLMKSIGAAFFGTDALPDVNHMRGMQYVLCI